MTLPVAAVLPQLPPGLAMDGLSRNRSIRITACGLGSRQAIFAATLGFVVGPCAELPVSGGKVGGATYAPPKGLIFRPVNPRFKIVVVMSVHVPARFWASILMQPVIIALPVLIQYPLAAA